MTSLINKYRPTTYEEVFGQDPAIRTLEAAQAGGMSQQFLFTGPSGTGKTTLARITAQFFGAEEVLEIDAATNSGVDAIREVTGGLQYLSLFGSKRAIIIDEAHRLSANAWDALLKELEEPPDHVVWALCSTNPGKIPATIKRRCTHITLKTVPTTDITYLLEQIIQQEDLNLPPDVADICARMADGSPGRAISNLVACLGAATGAEARELCRDVSESPVVIELCQLVLKGGPGSWEKAVVLINELKGEDNETVRIIICNYLSKVLSSTPGRSPAQAAAICYKLDAFMQQPYRTSDGLAPIFLSVAGALRIGG